jgi:hypothetical protein
MREFPLSTHLRVHNTCRGCIKKYFHTKIKDNGLTTITCPGLGCKTALDYDAIKQFASKNDFDRYAMFSLISEVDMTSYYTRNPAKLIRTFDTAQIPNAEWVKSLRMGVTIPVVKSTDIRRYLLFFRLYKMQI